MKKIISFFIICILAVGVLASCDNSASLAKKVNKAYENGTPMSFLEVKNELPEDAFYYGTKAMTGNENGVFCVVKGVDSIESFYAMIASLESGATYDGIIIQIVNGKAYAAVGGKITKTAYEAMAKK